MIFGRGGSQRRRRTAGAIIGAALTAALATGVAGAGPTPAGPLPAAPAEHHSEFLRLSIDRVTPSIVDADSSATVTVSGTITNIGDRGVADVAVRLQGADPITADDQLRSALTWSEDRYGWAGEFVPVADTLAEGETADFTVALPLDSPIEPSLRITEPGVYPVLVNVNATPDFGGPARLDDARFLLPVLAVPPTGTEDDDTPAAPRPEPAPPTPMSMLVPLAAAPQQAAGTPGTFDGGEVRLIGDDLAGELADGGRLRGLVDAVDTVTTADPAAAAGLCLAVDPDLLVTVDHMRSGYVISEDPADPDSATRPGTGSEAADRWLTDVRRLAENMCTIAVPYAQVDIGAVTELRTEPLTDIAVAQAAAVVDALLETTTVPSVLWPATGQIAPQVAQAVAAEDSTTLLLADNAVADPEPLGARVAGMEQHFGVTTFPMPAAAALAAIGTDPIIPSFVPPEMRYDLDYDSATARLQDALAAMAWYALGPDGPDESEDQPGPVEPPRPVLLAPPQLWTVDAQTATRMLGTYTGLIGRGLAVPAPLTDLLGAAADPAAPPVGLVDPVLGDGVGEFGPPADDDSAAAEEAVAERTQAVPGSLVTIAEELIPAQRSLAASLTDSPTTGLTVTDYLTPLRRDVLRMLSTAERGGSDTGAAQQRAEQRGQALRRSVEDQFAAVTVLAPGATYTLASAQSPLLIVARNDLPMAVRARLDIQAPEEVTITGDGSEYVVPARGTRQIQVPADIEFSRELDVRVQLLTLDGTPLGEQVHISVNSNAYGNIIPIATIVFGALLLILGGRRAWHRIKGRPDPADERRPVISPPDKFVYEPPPSVVVRHPATAPPRAVQVRKPDPDRPRHRPPHTDQTDPPETES